LGIVGYGNFHDTRGSGSQDATPQGPSVLPHDDDDDAMMMMRYTKETETDSSDKMMIL
jgi:hypothetical protein